MAASKDVAFEPTFEGVLAEHFHDAAGDIEFTTIGIFGLEFGEPGFLGGGVDGGEFVGGGFIGTKDAEGMHIPAHHFGEEVSEDVGGRGVGGAGRFYIEGVIAEVGEIEIFAEETAVGVRIGGDAT